MLDWEAIGNALLVIVAAFAAFGAALWLSLVIWTFRDMRARSRDLFAQILAAAVVAVLSIPGLLIYLILRPRETLAQAYERSLEEEALLQSIEEKPVCPGCGRAARDHWQVCPYCHTKLKKVCITCGEMLQLGWNICPHCASSQLGYAAAEPSTERRRSASKASKAQKQEARPASYSEETVYSGDASRDRTALYPEEAYLAEGYQQDDYPVGDAQPQPYDSEPTYARSEQGNSRSARRASARADVVQFIEDDDF